MEKHLIQEIRRRFKRLPAPRRASEIKQFMSKSPSNKELIRKVPPDLYREAVSSAGSSSGGELSESNQPVELCAKPR